MTWRRTSSVGPTPPRSTSGLRSGSERGSSASRGISHSITCAAAGGNRASSLMRTPLVSPPKSAWSPCGWLSARCHVKTADSSCFGTSRGGHRPKSDDGTACRLERSAVANTARGSSCVGCWGERPQHVMRVRPRGRANPPHSWAISVARAAQLHHLDEGQLAMPTLDAALGLRLGVIADRCPKVRSHGLGGDRGRRGWRLVAERQAARTPPATLLRED